MLCQRVQLSSKGNWPETDGVCFHRESQWRVGKMQRHQSGRTVGSDQFLWLQHPDFCASCQFAWQIPRHYEGAAKTFALYWSLLSPHCCQNGRGREQYLNHPWTHSHQPKQVHCVRPLSYGEDHLREAQRGAQSSDGLNFSTALLFGLHIPVCWKPSVLALSLIAQEFEALQSITSLKIVQQFQRYLKISDSALHHWKELVAKCMTEYRSSECNKPDNKKLVWIVSRRTAQNLQASHFSVPGLPTIPEGSWDESESEDSCEDMSCGEDSPCGSPGSDGEGAFFPSAYLNRRKWRFLIVH